MKKHYFIILLIIFAIGNLKAEQLTIASIETNSEESLFPKKNAIDSSKKTRWASIGTLDNTQVTLDLGGLKHIEGIDLLMYKGRSRIYPLQIEVATTDSFKSIWKGNTSKTDDYFSIKNLNAVEGRYLRITMRDVNSNNNNWLSMYDIKVYGKSKTVNPSINLIKNPNFTFQAGTLGGGIASYSNPKIAKGRCFTKLSFCSQSKRTMNNELPKASGQNAFSLMRGRVSSDAYRFINIPPFSGDTAYGLKASSTMLYSNGNVYNKEFVVWAQEVKGLVVGKEYLFYFYANNAIDAPQKNKFVDPILRIRRGGDLTLPNGLIEMNAVRLNEGNNYLNKTGWRRFEVKFKAKSTHEVIKITNAAKGTYGDDFAITALGLVKTTATVKRADIESKNIVVEENREAVAEVINVSDGKKVIIDTDLLTDNDDAGALGVAHALADNGEIEILAMMMTGKDNNHKHSMMVSAINHYYNRADMPIGESKRNDMRSGWSPFTFPHPQISAQYKGYHKNINAFPSDHCIDREWRVDNAGCETRKDAVELYCEQLRDADEKVTIVVIGHQYNVADLLKKKSQHCNGVNLVKSKVSKLILTGWQTRDTRRPDMNFGEKNANVTATSRASNYLFDHWPNEVPIVIVNSEVGSHTYGGEVYRYKNSTSPMAFAYATDEGHTYGEGTFAIEEGKQLVDHMAILYAARGLKYDGAKYWKSNEETNTAYGYFNLSSNGRVVWDTSKDKNHHYLIKNIKNYNSYMKKLMNDLMGKRVGKSQP